MRLRTFFVFGTLILIFHSMPTGAQANSGTAKTRGAGISTEERDGQHDFDFALGSWKIHLSRLQNPLTGSKTWIEFDGTVVCRKVWDGHANLEEFEVKSPTGPIEGLTLRLYSPKTHQWSIYWADSRNATIDPSPQVGKFKEGRGEFYGQDTLNGKLIYVRFVWTKTDTDGPHFEQSFSNDGGKTWEVNWITDQTRVGGAQDQGTDSAVRN